MSQLDDLLAQVQQNTSAESSAAALIRGLANQLTESAGDSAKITAIANQLKISGDSLAAAVVANTALVSNPPTPVQPINQVTPTTPSTPPAATAPTTPLSTNPVVVAQPAVAGPSADTGSGLPAASNPTPFATSPSAAPGPMKTPSVSPPSTSTKR